ncbi:PepSY-associated TM helix domain-containing protein [Dactylosporangium sp. NPDC005555]|uniref:PepSY-associated TM helix domain-containing protein n=1 Tax=Dactylosporangium sp. NPDC005555 TaxID=3154889 RepID=UPI0033B7DC0D
MSKLAGSLSAVFVAYAEFWLGVARPVPPFRVEVNGPDLELTVEVDGAGRRVVGRPSAYAVLAHRFWAVVLPPPVVIPSLIREGNEGHEWDRFDEQAAPDLRVVAACLEEAGERTEAALIHRLLADTDGDRGVPPWTSAEEYTGHYEVPVSLLAEVQRRSPVVERLAGRKSWNAAAVKSRRELPGPAGRLLRRGRVSQGRLRVPPVRSAPNRRPPRRFPMSVATEVSPPTEEPAPTAAPSPRPIRSWSVVPLLTRLHFYAGILVAPLLVVAAVTGLLFVFTPQLDSIVYDKELHVAGIGPGLPKPLSEQVAAAIAAHPTGTFSSVIPAAAPDATTKVVFTVPELGEKQHTVYVDPYTGEIRGQLVTWWGSTPLTTWLDDFHRHLHLDDLGVLYSETAASWLWVVALGGLILWCNRQWRQRGEKRRSRVEATLLYDTAAAKGVRRTRGMHAATGVWLIVGLLFLSATGLTWSDYAGANFSLALDSLNAGRPELVTTGATAGGAAGASGGGHHSEGGAAAAGDPAQVDTVLHIARTNGITGQMEIGAPAEEGAAWTVVQNDNVWPVHFDKLAVDPVAGVVVDRVDYADWPFLAKLSALGIQAHMGYLFGLANQLLLAALAVGLLCVIFLGLPHVVAAPPHPRRATRPRRHPTRPRRVAPAATAAAHHRRPRHRRRRLGTPRIRGHPRRVPDPRPRHRPDPAPPPRHTGPDLTGARRRVTPRSTRVAQHRRPADRVRGLGAQPWRPGRPGYQRVRVRPGSAVPPPRPQRPICA